MFYHNVSGSRYTHFKHSGKTNDTLQQYFSWLVLPLVVLLPVWHMIVTGKTLGYEKSLTFLFDNSLFWLVVFIITMQILPAKEAFLTKLI